MGISQPDPGITLQAKALIIAEYEIYCPRSQPKIVTRTQSHILQFSHATDLNTGLITSGIKQNSPHSRYGELNPEVKLLTIN